MVTWGSSGGRGGAASSLVGGNGGSSDAEGSGTWLVAGTVTSSFTGSAASFATTGPFLCPGKCTFVLCCKLSRCCRYQYCCCSYNRNHFFFKALKLQDKHSAWLAKASWRDKKNRQETPKARFFEATNRYII